MSNWHGSPSLREAALLAGKQYVEDVEAGRRALCKGVIRRPGTQTGCLIGEMAAAVAGWDRMCWYEHVAAAIGVPECDLSVAATYNDAGNPRAGIDYLASLPY
jgi:hypothetical protein